MTYNHVTTFAVLSLVSKVPLLKPRFVLSDVFAAFQLHAVNIRFWFLSIFSVLFLFLDWHVYCVFLPLLLLLLCYSSLYFLSLLLENARCALTASPRFPGKASESWRNGGLCDFVKSLSAGSEVGREEKNWAEQHATQAIARLKKKSDLHLHPVKWRTGFILGSSMLVVGTACTDIIGVTFF